MVDFLPHLDETHQLALNLCEVVETFPFLFETGVTRSVTKGPGSLEGLVRIWKIWVFLVLPGLQMNSKAYHNPHAN